MAARTRGGPPVARTEIEVGDDLRRLYDQHYRSLVKLASFLVDDRETCEEVVQDVFVRLLAGRRRLEPGKEAAYLRGAVLNGARSALRKRRVRRATAVPAAGQTASPEGAALDRVVADRMLVAVRRLPARQADVLTLRYFLDLSEAEIAETLGIAPGTVKRHAHRGLATLADVLEDPR